MIPTCSEAGVLGALAGVVGTLQAMEVIREIVGFGEGLVGKLLLIDALTPAVRDDRLRLGPGQSADRNRRDHQRGVIANRTRPLTICNAPSGSLTLIRPARRRAGCAGPNDHAPLPCGTEASGEPRRAARAAREPRTGDSEARQRLNSIGFLIASQSLAVLAEAGRPAVSRQRGGHQDKETEHPSLSMPGSNAAIAA
jgi:hypothetical protein